jgi:asparagine synthase (glutamine-hydrolysing)
VRPEFIEQLLHAHRSEHAAYYGNALWVMTMLDLWLEAQGRAR